MLQPASSQFIGRPCIFHHCMYSASFTSTSPLLCRDSGASALYAAGSVLLVKYLKCKKHKKMKSGHFLWQTAYVWEALYKDFSLAGEVCLFKIQMTMLVHSSHFHNQRQMGMLSLLRSDVKHVYRYIFTRLL